MRIALRYACLYAVLMIIGSSILYWASSRYVDEQISAGLQQRLVELLRIDHEKGRQKLIDTLRDQQSIAGDFHRRFLLSTADGKKIAGNLNGWPPDLKMDGRVINVWIADQLISKQGDPDGYWPMIAQTLADGSRLLLAQSLVQSEELQEVILYTILLILIGSIILVLTMGWFIGRSMLTRIDHVIHTAKAIISGDFSQRIPVSHRHDEFDELAGQLNYMLNRIEQLLTGMRQVTDNVAHDLRRPLSRLRNRLEITLLEKRDIAEYQQVLTETIADTEELIRTFNALLEIAQAEAGSFRGEWSKVDISTLLYELGKLYQQLAESQGQKLTIEVQHGIQVKGNRHLLAQAISNLLDNAIKYSPVNGKISLLAEAEMIQVTDNGPGIPSAEYNRVMDRFVRLDNARSTPGNGLGLSLVKVVGDLHNITIRLKNNQPGLIVQLLLRSKRQ